MAIKRVLDIDPTAGLFLGYDSDNGTFVVYAKDTLMLTLTTAGALTPAGSVDGSVLSLASQARGDMIRRGATSWERVSASTLNRALVGDGTDPVATRLPVCAKSFSFAAAAVIAANTTPLVILDHSAMAAAGEIAAGDALIFHGAILQINGGSANYDQNQNTIAKYQTAGGGASVSLTLANWFNGKADGVMTTLKPIATDVVPEADQDIVLTSSASPKNAQGDRPLAGVVYYSVYTPV